MSDALSFVPTHKFEISLKCDRIVDRLHLRIHIGWKECRYCSDMHVQLRNESHFEVPHTPTRFWKVALSKSWHCLSSRISVLLRMRRHQTNIIRTLIRAWRFDWACCLPLHQQMRHDWIYILDPFKLTEKVCNRRPSHCWNLLQHGKVAAIACGGHTMISNPILYMSPTVLYSMWAGVDEVLTIVASASATKCYRTRVVGYRHCKLQFSVTSHREVVLYYITIEFCR